MRNARLGDTGAALMAEGDYTSRPGDVQLRGRCHLMGD